MALKAKASEFRCKAAVVGAMRTRGTLNPEKVVLQKFAGCSPNAFLRLVREPLSNIHWGFSCGKLSTPSFIFLYPSCRIGVHGSFQKKVNRGSRG